MKYRVVLEVYAANPVEAIEESLDMEADVRIVQVRQEPFDEPSPMWDVTVNDGEYDLRRLR